MRLQDVVVPKRTVTAPRRRAPFFDGKKVAILGCTESLLYTPWHDPSWVLVAHNSARNRIAECGGREPDYWMDFHPPACFTSEKTWYKGYYDWLKHQRVPIFMQDAYPEIPAAIRYPKERILSEHRRFFTNQVSWIIALAATEGVRHIGLYGCQYRSDSEYGIQRESCVYWMGFFEGRGGTIHLPPAHNTLLCQPSQLYGYESHDHETGRLIDAYRVKPPDAIATVKTRGDGIDHMPLPNQEPVAWDRAKLFGVERELALA